MKTFFILLVIGFFLTSCGEAGERFAKDNQSNLQGGLDRIVKVYSDSGLLLETYEGRLDIETYTYLDRKVKFDLNGKRHIIYGGVVLVDEK